MTSNHSPYCGLTYLNIEFLDVKKAVWSVWMNVWSGYWSMGKVETHVLLFQSLCEAQMSDFHVLIIHWFHTWITTPVLVISLHYLCECCNKCYFIFLFYLKNIIIFILFFIFYFIYSVYFLILFFLF